MYTLARSLPLRRLLIQQAPSLIAAFVVAEVFYKFGSFGLECAAFLGTWFVFDMVTSILTDKIFASETATTDAG